MAGRASRALVLAALTLLAAAAVPAGSGAASPSPMAAVTATQAPFRYFDVGGTRELVSTTGSQSIPEVIALPSGDFAVGYLDGFYNYYGSPAFSVYNGTSGARAAGQFDVSGAYQWDSWANTTSRGAYTALDQLGRVARVQWAYAFPNSLVTVKVMDQSGLVAIPETRVGTTPYAASAATVAIAGNNSILIVHYDGQVQYSVMLANGSWGFRNATIDSSSVGQFAPQMVYNGAAQRAVVAWGTRAAGGVVVGVEPNGSVAWTHAFALDGANMTLAALPSGDTVVMYAGADALHAFRLDGDGNVVKADTALDTEGARVRAPRAAVMEGGEVAVVYGAVGEGTDLDVWAMAFNATSMQVTINATQVCNDLASNTNPTAAFMADGALWVAWQNESSTWYANISGARLVPRWAGFELSSPEGAVQVPRGETWDVPVTLRSLVTEDSDYDLGVAFAAYGGPTNWTGSVMDAAGTAVLAKASLGPLASLDLTLRVRGPVVDPAGYGALVSLLAADGNRSATPLNLRVNLTVFAGHRFAVTPADQNLTALPGSLTNITFAVRNAGTMDEVDASLALVPAPPAGGWSASFAPAEVSAAPGETVTVVLAVATPANAAAGQSYCGRLRAQNANDPFSLASAGFCVRVALVAVPGIDPPSLAAEVNAGEGAVTVWTITNTGNAPSPIVCAIAIRDPLPAGWAGMVDPDTSPLRGGQVGNVVVSVTAPALAGGGTQLNVTLKATCAGSSDFAEATFALRIRTVHNVQWRSAGGTAEANATGAGIFQVTAENLGNVDEPVTLEVGVAPPGFTVETLWTGGNSAGAIPAHSTGTVSVAVQAPAGTPSGNYAVQISLETTESPRQAYSFTLRVMPVYGLLANFSATPAAVGPEGVVQVLAHIEHTANTQDTYVLKVEVGDIQAWGSKAVFLPAAGNASEVRGSISFAAFQRGLLQINLTAPREPSAEHVMIKVTLSSPRGSTVVHYWEVEIVLPDLTVSLEGALEGVEGLRTLSFNCTVSNGGVALQADVALTVYLDGVALDTSIVSKGMGQGESVDIAFEKQIMITAGRHEVRVTVDPPGRPGTSSVYGAAFERSEGNNSAGFAFTLDPRAQGPGGASDPNVTTPAGGGLLGIVILALMAAGTAGYAVVRMKMRRGRHE